MKRFNKISWKFIATSTIFLVIALAVTTAISTVSGRQSLG